MSGQREKNMKTQKEVLQAFWDYHQNFQHLYRSKKRQNDYPCEVRLAFVDYVDDLRKSGLISEKLANRATL